jgi:hypothetical protein
MSAKPISLLALTLAAACARPPAIDGADCPCPGGYRCDDSKSVCIPTPAPTVPPAGGGSMSAPPPAPAPTPGAVPPGAQCSSTQNAYLPRRLVRLSPAQLAGAIEDLTGYLPPAGLLPTDVDDAPAIDVAARGYDAIPSTETVTILADVARRAALAMALPAGCTGPALSDDCSAFLHALARRAQRRDLTGDELSELDATAQQDAALLGAAGAVRLAVEEMIQSPQFVYRPELGSLTAGASSVQLGGDEIASALAFVLTDRPPDQPLIDAAPHLTEPAILAAQAARLAGTPAAREKTVRFLEAYADVDRLFQAPPEAGPSLAIVEDMQRETRAFLSAVLDRGGTAAELFGASYTFVTVPLALYYGTSAVASNGTLEEDIPNRVGLLSQGSFLVAHASGSSGVPARRGVIMARMLFDMALPLPPPGLPPTVSPAPPDVSGRERAAQIINQPACAACHGLIDPLGLGLEHFDGAGRYRATQGGKPIDTSISNYPNVMGSRFGDSIELARQVIATPRGQDGLVSQYIDYVLGYPGCSAADVSAAFLAGGARIPALLQALPGTITFTRRSVR